MFLDSFWIGKKH